MSSKKIFVGNIAYTATTTHLQTAFEDFGEITQVKIVTDRATGKSRGFGFVEFASEDQARKALEKMNGHDILGRKIRVSEARDKDEAGSATI